MTDFSCSSTVFGVPSSHLHANFENFRWPSVPVQRAVEDFMELQLKGEKANLLLTGGSGLGKTHLSVALYRWGVRRWGSLHCALVHVPQFFHEVKKSFDGQTGDPFQDVADAKKIMVIDDILGRNPTPWELDHVVFRLIDSAYTNQASMVVTANHTLEQIGGILKPHEMSRLLEDVIHIEFKGPDQRLKG